MNQAPVAQLDRVIGFEPIGREFESLRARQVNHGLTVKGRPFFLPEGQFSKKVTGSVWVGGEGYVLIGIPLKKALENRDPRYFYYLILFADWMKCQNLK